MTGSVECEIYPKMLRNLSEKLKAKFPFTARGYAMVRQLQQNDKKEKKGKAKKKK